MRRWPLVQLRHVARLAYGDSLSAEDRTPGEVQVFGSNGPVGEHDHANTRGPALVVGRKGSFGKVRFSDRPVFAIDTTYFIDSSTTQSHMRWLYYALSTLNLDELSQDVGVPGLSREAAYAQRLPLPPVDAQRAIADYLDIETARIDALIAKKQRMIELLHEQVDAIIREEVLGAGQMTGPPWASSMGADRQLVRLGSVLRLRQERNDPIRVGQVLSLTAARGVIPYEEKGDIGNKASDDISRYSIVRVGDIVLNSMNVIIGSVGLSKYEGVLSPVYYVMMPVDEALVDRRFLAYHFKIREFQRQLIRLGYGILDHRMRIPWINLKSQELALPSITEQRRVADVLDRVEDRHRALVRRLETQIELLQEHRQALITAAVTGELEVAGVAA